MVSIPRVRISERKAFVLIAATTIISILIGIIPTIDFTQIGGSPGSQNRVKEVLVHLYLEEETIVTKTALRRRVTLLRKEESVAAPVPPRRRLQEITKKNSDQETKFSLLRRSNAVIIPTRTNPGLFQPEGKDRSPLPSQIVSPSPSPVHKTVVASPKNMQISSGMSSSQNSLTSDPVTTSDPVIDDEESQSSDRNGYSRTVPATMLGLASSVIFCACFLYYVDVRDRVKYETWMDEQQLANLEDDNSSDKSQILDDDGNNTNDDDDNCGSIDSHITANGGHWIHTMIKDLASYRPHSKVAPPANILPLLNPGEGPEQRDDVELGYLRSIDEEDGKGTSSNDDLTFSHTSILSGSIMDVSYNYSEIVDQSRLGASVTNQEEKAPTESITTNTTKSVKRILHTPPNEECSSSVCSSLTDRTNETNSTSEDVLLGEDCVVSSDSDSEDEKDECTHDTEQSTVPSVDTNDEEGANKVVETLAENLTGEDFIGDCRDDMNVSNEVMKLERLLSTIYPEESRNKIKERSWKAIRRPPRPLVRRNPLVRDIFFVPPSAGGKGNIGLLLDDPPEPESHPAVTKVDLSSTFAGRIFVGDLILRVNDIATTGMAGKNVLKVIANDPMDLVSCPSEETKPKERMIKMIKLTVIGPEGPHHPENNDTDQCVDYGKADGRQEV